MDFRLDDSSAQLACVVPSVVGIVYGLIEFVRLRSIDVSKELDLDQGLLQAEEGKARGIVATMVEISGYIADGAEAFLIEEYKYMMVYVVVFSCIIGPYVGYWAMICFIVGSLTSIVSGYIGMKTATMCNVRTTFESWRSLPRGFDVAIRGGSVMGVALVGLGVLVLYGLIFVMRMPQYYGTKNAKEMYEALAGYGLGGSSIALFGRVGGGIYTKAADVGADLSGKNDWGLDEDDIRNPACIADNVGDNVGDVAGMGADLFGSFAEATCAAMVIAANSNSVMVGDYHNKMGISNNYPAMLYPLILSSMGLVVGMLTLFLVKVVYTVNTEPDASIEQALKGVLVISTVLMSPTSWYVAKISLPETFQIDGEHLVTPMDCTYCVLAGLWSGLIIGYVTEYYTSHSYRPVREISETQIVSAATGIIYGLALGYKSNIIPTFCLAGTVCLAHQLCGMYGVALGALGMLGTLSMGLTIDVYGPISDNAGGIAEMCGLGESVRRRTDALDAAGNTTAAIGKGFAIGSAALVSLALFGAFCVRANVTIVNVLDAWTFTGLFYGAMMPYWFSAMTMKSVGEAANDMVKECNRQFPGIMQGAKPEYNHCIAISTRASLREMIAPGALVILSPLILGGVLGKNCTAGMLSGSLVSGVQLAISMSNSGGAWDNAKKYIEAGGLGPGQGKKSQPHKNAVIGDTVGDPLKDTSGPAINIVIKLSAIMSLVFGSVIANCSTPSGGPLWLQ